MRERRSQSVRFHAREKKLPRIQPVAIYEANINIGERSSLWIKLPNN
jgi:hypothetical protein